MSLHRNIAAPSAAATAIAMAGTSSLRIRDERRRGRGAGLNMAGRFEATAREAFDDGWQTLDELPPFRTDVTAEAARTAITRNQSPDLPFDRSVNPYRGCEHGCTYCFARPTHSYMGLSAGLDFETKLFAKPNAAKLLRKELAHENYDCRPIMLGTNTDPYQPIEKQYRITRDVLQVLESCDHPVGIVTKSALVLRDIDILSRMAAKGLVRVALSVTTLDRKLARAMEPRAATPGLRLDTMRKLAEAGIPVSVSASPVIPSLTDHELERILDAGRAAGASHASFALLRLPDEVSPIFREWIERHAPDKAAHVMSLLRSMRSGRDNNPEFGSRMRGVGPYAWQLGRRFEITSKKLGLSSMNSMALPTHKFRPPTLSGQQLSLF